MTIENAGRRCGAAFLVFLMSFNVVQASWAKTIGKNQIAKDVRELDSFSNDYNSKPKDPQRIDKLLVSYEKFMGRKLASDEKNFLTLQLAAVGQIPRFEIKDNLIKIFDSSGGSKDLLLTIEVVDADKNIFKYGGKTFQLDANKPLQENVQQILKLIQAKEASSSALLQMLNSLGIPQAHAEFPPWLKAFLIVGVAIIAGIFSGKTMQKNQANAHKSDGAMARTKQKTDTHTTHNTIETPTNTPRAITPANTREPSTTPISSAAEPSIV